ncbi:MAG TPA: lipocalin family protein [Pyrinomonadaceae bacterium]|nr:lipocalin family protein [Pyrinomonadaceae bacterium]
MTRLIRTKFSLTLILGILVFPANLFAQAPETFDISSFQPPQGWNKQVGQDAIQFSTTDKDAYCLVTLFRSVPSLGSPKENFEAAWNTIVKEAVTVSAAPQMFPSDPKGEWLVAGGFAPFEKDGAKGVAVLYTASGYGKMVNALVLTNTQAYEAPLTAFLNSISFKKPDVETQPQTRTDQNGSQPSLAGNFWKKGGISKGLLGHADLSPGTFSDTYQFFSNGTYKFTRAYSQYAAPKWYLENEEGTYTVTGNTITITSKKAVFSQHRINREDPPLKSGSLPLSTVQYRFEFWKYDDNWRLLLSPADGNETKRDGTFSFWRNGEAQRTYQYHLVDAKGNLIQ